ncbi:hypothetical protein HDU81_000470, partial [Chytriomyces hyalinus]
ASSTNVAIRARRAFTNLKYEDGENFNKFISEMERYHRILENDAEVKDKEMVIQMMSSLPESWDSFLQGLQTQTTIMTDYSNFKTAILTEHEYCVDQSEKKSTGSKKIAMQTKHSVPKFKGKCNNCGKKGHKKTNCWSKGGDKEGQGPKQRERKNDEQKANQVNQTTVKRLSESVK